MDDADNAKGRLLFVCTAVLVVVVLGWLMVQTWWSTGSPILSPDRANAALEREEQAAARPTAAGALPAGSAPEGEAVSEGSVDPGLLSPAALEGAPRVPALPDDGVAR